MPGFVGKVHASIMLRALLELSRVSNLPTVWTNVLAAWIIASGPRWQWTPALGWLLLGASLIYSAGMILNDAFDAAWDRNHRPERPIPSGRISLSTVWAIGLAWLLGGAALMILLGGASWLMTLLLLAAILAYDAYHKPWAGSVIVMGACRTLLYWVVGSSVEGAFDNLSAAPFLIASGLTLGGYIVGLSLAARREHSSNRASSWLRGAGIVLLWMPLLNSGLGILLAGLLGGDHDHGLWGALLGFPLMIVINPVHALPMATLAFALWHALNLLSTPPPSNIGKGVGWLLASIPLADALAVSPFSWPTAAAFCVLPPLLRLWQRWVAAT